MDNRAIGVFDSGLGGLTALKVLEETLPNETLIYFGDSGRMPYGSRSAEELRKIAVEDAGFVSSFGVKAMMVACGSMSAVAMETLRAAFDVPFFSMKDAACRAVAEITHTKRVGVIATEASIRSEMFARGIRALDSGIEVIAKACPSLAAIVEQGHFRPGDEIGIRAVEEELAPLKGSGIDTLLLGCTHYPLLSEIITDFLGEDVKLISCGAESAYALADYLRKNGQLAEAGRGQRRYFTSGDVALFADGAGDFLGHPICPEQHIL